MDKRLSVIERAFEIAKAGQAPTVAEIDAAIRREGYPIGSLEGPALRKQLRALIKTAREKDPKNVQ